MNNHTAIWKVIKEWINSQYRDTSFSNMPLSIKNSLDKASCIKIMQERLLGYDSDNIYNIKYLPEYLKSDIEIAVLAIELYSNNIFEISQSLITSVDFHKLLIQNTNIYYEYIFGHSPSSIRGNKDFVNQIISDFPTIYSSLTEELRLDRVILNKVLKKKVFPERLPKDFSNDKKIILKLIEVISYNDKKRNFRNKYDNDWLFSFISKELLADREIIIKLFISIKYISLDVPDNLKTDKEIIMNAVKSNPSYYEKINNYLKTDHNIAVEAFKGDYKLFIKYCSEYNIDNITILEYLKSLNEGLYPFWEYELEYYKIFEEIVEKLVEIGMFNHEIALQLASIWPIGIDFYKYFKILNLELKKNKTILMALLNSTTPEWSFSLEPEDEVTIQYIYKNYILPFHPNDRDLILQTVKNAPSLYANIPDVFKFDEEIIITTSRLISLKKRDEFLNSLADGYRNNKTFIIHLLEEHLLEDFSENKNIFSFASDLLRDDSEFVKEVIKTQPQSILYASERLKNDEEYQRLAFNSFRKVRKLLRRRNEETNRKYQFNISFCEGKSDNELDLWFLEKNCKKLLNNYKKNLKHKITDAIEPDDLDTLPF